MNGTRITSAGVFILVVAGITTVALSRDWWFTLLGAILISGGLILFARHFWRQSELRWKRESAALNREFSAHSEKRSEEMADSLEAVNSRIDDVVRRIDVFTRGVLEHAAQVELDVERLSETAQKQYGNLGHRIDRSERAWTRALNTLEGQISGVIGVYHTLRPSHAYPSFGGWAISGDCALRLVSMILGLRPQWVIEAGSGLSTILIAAALERNGGHGRVIALEHDKKWLDHTRALLGKHALDDRVQLLHARLVDCEIDGIQYKWYDLSQTDLPEEVQLIFIDGPPQQTGALARYPAVPLLYDRLSIGGTVLMDDARREDERKAVEMWSDMYPGLRVTTHPDAKGTAQLTKVALD